MSQAYIVLGQTGEDALTVLNGNFTQLFGALTVPFKLTGVSGAFTQSIPANTFVTNISLTPIGGTPMINIGLTNNGGEILPTMQITQFTLIAAQQYFQNAGLIYFNTSGIGSFNIRIDYIANYN